MNCIDINTKVYRLTFYVHNNFPLKSVTFSEKSVSKAENFFQQSRLQTCKYLPQIIRNVAKRIKLCLKESVTRPNTNCNNMHTDII